jgi:hypothetical protein
VHFALASRRDLGSVTLGLAGCALLLIEPDSTLYVGTGLTLTAVISAAAWVRGSRHGVGRPGLNGLALGTVALAALTPLWLPALSPSLPMEDLRAALLMPCLFAGLMGGVLALERPGPRHIRVHWIGRIPIETPEDDEALKADPS